VHLLSGTDKRHPGSAWERWLISKTGEQRRAGRRVRFDFRVPRSGHARLLIVEDDEKQRKSIADLIGNGDVKSTAVGSAKEALALLKGEHFDCMVLDLGLPGTTGFDLLEQVKNQTELAEPSCHIYTGKDLTKTEETRLKKYAKTIINSKMRSRPRGFSTRRLSFCIESKPTSRAQAAGARKAP